MGKFVQSSFRYILILYATIEQKPRNVLFRQVVASLSRLPKLRLAQHQPGAANDQHARDQIACPGPEQRHGEQQQR